MPESRPLDWRENETYFDYRERIARESITMDNLTPETFRVQPIPQTENPFDITLRNIRTCTEHPKLRVKKQTWNFCHYCGRALIPFNGEYEP